MSKTEDLKGQRVALLLDLPDTRFIRFKGACLVSAPGTQGYVRLDSSRFAGLVYRLISTGVSRSNIADLQHAVEEQAEDWTDTAHLIAFGEQVWNTRTLDWDADAINYVYSTSITPQPRGSLGYQSAQQFFLQLAKGDEGLANDYVQAVAPLVMDRKPAGVVWFVGTGANGKSSYIDALYRILGKHFSSLTTAAIEDGKAAPSLNGVLGNICREASEARVEDTEHYKAIGTHEPFAIRRLYTQDQISVDTNFHTIFNANNIPVFSDKTKGARRRTLVVPFPATFQDDPTFEERTFTAEFLGGLVTLLLEAAQAIAANGYRYAWSDATIAAKDEYDNDVNSCEAFVRYLQESGVRGFYNYQVLKLNYEDWCNKNGLVPLGVTTLKRTLKQEVTPMKKSVREGGNIFGRQVFAEFYDDDLVWLDNGYGLRKPDEEAVITPSAQLSLSEDSLNEW